MHGLSKGQVLVAYLPRERKDIVENDIRYC